MQDELGNFAPEKELVENVHGVQRTFLDIGEVLKCRLSNDDIKSSLDSVFSKSKGLGSLMNLMKYAEESNN